MPAVLSPGSDLLTREQAAAYLGVKPQTLAGWATTKRYDLPMVKIGRNIVRYRLSDLQAFAARHAEAVPAV
jgi:hypothetical protein